MSGGQGLGFFFTSLQIWVRANDGSIAVGTLEPGVSGSRVTPLDVPPTSTVHYEGGLALRCIRRGDGLYGGATAPKPGTIRDLFVTSWVPFREVILEAAGRSTTGR